MYPLMKNLFVEFRNPHFEYKIVRWMRAPGRKPFWFPMAKTKMFKLPKVRQTNPAEDAELQRLNPFYELHLHSLRTFIYNDESIKITAEASKYSEPEENLQASHVRNDEWNQKSAELRKLRLERVKQEEEENAIRLIEERENQRQARREKITRIARIESERSKTFIKKENIDKALEECINSVIAYDYAIDLNGNVYKNNEIVDNLSREKEVEKEEEEISQ